MAWVVRKRGDATWVELRLECEDRTTTWGWSPTEATAEHFAATLRVPSALAPDGTQELTGRRYVHERWTLMLHKEVGPPRWVWPHVGLWPRRDRISALIGWGFTAYHAMLSWKRDAE
jgi:hypothetical protein